MTNFTTFCNCFLCGQSITQQKNYKNGSACKFTFKVYLANYSLNVKRVKKRVNANSLEKEWKPLKNSCYPLEKERNEKKSEIFHSKKSEKRVRVNTSEHHSKMYCPLFNSLKNGHSLAESERHSFSSEYSTILLVLLTIHSKRSEVHSQRVNVHSLKI